MSDWYSRALQRARPTQQGPVTSPGTAPRYPVDRPLSTPVGQYVPPASQTVPDEMLPPEMRWAQKLTAAARNAITNGQAHKTDSEPCPQCGGTQYFSRQVSKRMPPPAPHCYNCGYNDGMFEQGLEGNWVGAQP